MSLNTRDNRQKRDEKKKAEEKKIPPLNPDFPFVKRHIPIEIFNILSDPPPPVKH